MSFLLIVNILSTQIYSFLLKLRTCHCLQAYLMETRLHQGSNKKGLVLYVNILKDFSFITTTKENMWRIFLKYRITERYQNSLPLLVNGDVTRT